MELIRNGSFDRPRSLEPYWDTHPDDRWNRVICTDAHSGRCCLEFRHRGDLHDPFYVEQSLEGSLAALSDLTLWGKGTDPTTYPGSIRVTLEYTGVTDHFERYFYSSVWTPIDPIPTRRSRRLLRIRIEPLTSRSFYLDDIALDGCFMLRRPFELRDFRWPHGDDPFRFRPPIPYSAASEESAMEQQDPALSLVQLLEDRLIGIERRMDQLVQLSRAQQHAQAEQQGGTKPAKERKPEKG